MSLILIINFVIALFVFRILEGFLYNFLKEKEQGKKSFRERLEDKIKEEEEIIRNLKNDKNP